MADSLFPFTLGDFKCFAIRDGGHMGSADFLFTNAPAEELSSLLHKHHLEKDRLLSNWTCLLVDTGRKRLLVDTGIGSGEPRGGNLLPQLEQTGYQPDDIDLVFLTHGHPDHLGGCTGEEGKPVFVNARHVISEREYNYWMEEQDQGNNNSWMARFAGQKLLAIEEQLELVGGDAELLPGIRTIEAFGHTPGHLGLEINSAGETLLDLADSALHPLHLERPEWVAKVDILPDQMVATRVRLLERATREKALVLLFHFDFPSLGYVDQVETWWRWSPV